MSTPNTDELSGFVSTCKYREGERGRRGKQDIPDSDLRSETLMIIIKNMYLFRRTYSESFHDRVFFSRKEKGGVFVRSSEYVGMSMSWVCHLFAHPLFSGVFVFVDTCSPITRTYPQPRVLCMWYCQVVDISIVNFLIGVSDCSGVLVHKP